MTRTIEQVRADIDGIAAERQALWDRQDTIARRTINVGSPMTQAATARRLQREHEALDAKRDALYDELNALMEEQ